MADTPSFTNLVPGFDFLQNLVKNAGTALPSIGQWVAPTLNPEEIEKRIGELRTVQFWLEQNARMISATIQALEVQRMTLSTLKTMNVKMGDLRDSLTIRPPAAPPARPAERAPVAEPPPGDAGASQPSAAEAKPKPGAMVDPMQWWGALTNQFTELAASALKDTGVDAAGKLAGSMLKQSMAAAGAVPNKTAAEPAAKAAPRRRAAPKRRDA